MGLVLIVVIIVMGVTVRDVMGVTVITVSVGIVLRFVKDVIAENVLESAQGALGFVGNVNVANV